MSDNDIFPLVVCCLQRFVIVMLNAFGHCIYVIFVMKTKATQTADIIKAIDGQLKNILAKDIHKIDNVNIRIAAFLQLIAA